MKALLFFLFLFLSSLGIANPSLNSSSQSFIVFTLFNAQAHQDDAIEIIIDRLSKVGQVNPIRITPDFDFSLFSKPQLTYTVQPLQSIECKGSSLLKASLELEKTVSSDGANHIYTSCIWADEYLFNGNAESVSQESISLSFGTLLDRFMKTYRTENPHLEETPTFYLLIN